MAAWSAGSGSVSTGCSAGSMALAAISVGSGSTNGSPGRSSHQSPPDCERDEGQRADARRHIAERQLPRRRLLLQPDAVGAHLALDVLDLLLADELQPTSIFPCNWS